MSNHEILWDFSFYIDIFYASSNTDMVLTHQKASWPKTYEFVYLSFSIEQKQNNPSFSALNMPLS